MAVRRRLEPAGRVDEALGRFAAAALAKFGIAGARLRDHHIDPSMIFQPQFFRRARDVDRAAIVAEPDARADRKRVVSGKSVSVRVNRVGWRISNTKHITSTRT